MESNKNNDNNNGGDEHEQQLRGSARKRTFSEVTNYEDKTAAGEEDQPEPEDCSSSKKNREEENSLDLEETSTTIMADLLSSYCRHRKLPAELNCQIFYCLNLPTRRKFICGLGWNFYAMFRYKLLIKSKRLCNPVGNGLTRWSSNTNATSEDGLNARNNTNGWQHIYAEKGLPISVADCRKDGFPGTICYYYEVKSLSARCVVGLLINSTIFGVCVGADRFRSSQFVIAKIATDGQRESYRHQSELPVETRPKPNLQGNVFGCGLLMRPDNKLTTFSL